MLIDARGERGVCDVCLCAKESLRHFREITTLEYCSAGARRLYCYTRICYLVFAVYVALGYGLAARCKTMQLERTAGIPCHEGKTLHKCSVECNVLYIIMTTITGRGCCWLCMQLLIRERREFNCNYVVQLYTQLCVWEDGIKNA